MTRYGRIALWTPVFALLAPVLAPLVFALPMRRAGGRPNEFPAELGAVHWGRDLAAATRRSKRSGRPLLLLFDEVPGCQTVRGYGAAVLSHPLIVEAIEDLFVPVVIYNNRGGRDAELLERFAEPAWNNPVVRLVDGQLRPLAPRLAGDHSALGLARAMVAALRRAGRPVPRYLGALVDELVARRRAKVVTLAMPCFWSGEAALGAVSGVIASRTGFSSGREVVEVRYDPRRLSLAALLRRARQRGMADAVFVHQATELPQARRIFGAKARPRRHFRHSPTDDKYRLRHSALAALPLTPLQKTRVNAALAAGQSAASWLSPRQRATVSASAH